VHPPFPHPSFTRPRHPPFQLWKTEGETGRVWREKAYLFRAVPRTARLKIGRQSQRTGTVRQTQAVSFDGLSALGRCAFVYPSRATAEHHGTAGS